MSTEPAGTSGARSSSPSLVATPFIWPHGGHRVFLCGSFTRWQDMIPMSQVEGCPSVYQVIWSLSPGYHQFKFLVDGEWRHNDQQPSVTDSAGNCSNCILVRELEGGSGPGGSVLGGSMDVEDGEMNIARVGMTSFSRPHEIPLEGMQNISVADVDASRHRIDNFLTSHTAYEVLPDSGKVVALDISLPIKQAFHVLYEQGIPLAPLWDSDQQQFVGMLTASDFIAILMQIGSHRAILSEEELETHTIAAWKAEKIRLTDAIQRRHPLHYVGPDDSLKEVVRTLLHHQVTTVPVLHFPGQEQALPQLLHLATLSGVLKCLCRHFQHSFGSLPLFNQPIGSLRLGTWRGDNPEGHLFVLRLNYSLSTALALFNQARVSSLPIVDENGSLIDIYARSDITALARDNTYAHVQLEHLTVERALQLVHDGSALIGGAPVLRCQMCLRTDTLQYIIKRLAIPGVRRIICVEAGSRRIEGIITLSDFFRFLLI
ncbi:hypothetical protein L7F22_062922 [Adiantum nelumboides]|nr:hypothetical protein [Adiantum nelumboides]